MATIVKENQRDFRFESDESPDETNFMDYLICARSYELTDKRFTWRATNFIRWCVFEKHFYDYGWRWRNLVKQIPQLTLICFLPLSNYMRIANRILQAFSEFKDKKVATAKFNFFSKRHGWLCSSSRPNHDRVTKTS